MQPSTVDIEKGSRFLLVSHTSSIFLGTVTAIWSLVLLFGVLPKYVDPGIHDDTSAVQHAGKDCWHQCGERGGYCSWCGTGNACCGKNWPGDPQECRAATTEFHQCTKTFGHLQHPGVDCWYHCNRGGYCEWCGAGNACCRRGYAQDPIECAGVQHYSTKHHECSASTPSCVSGHWHDTSRSSLLPAYVCQAPIGNSACMVASATHNGTCYFLQQEQVVYDAALAGCEDMGGSLVSIQSSFVNGIVREVCGAQQCWIGLAAGKGGFLWRDGATPGFTSWEEGRPAQQHHPALPRAAFINHMGQCMAGGWSEKFAKPHVGRDDLYEEAPEEYHQFFIGFVRVGGLLAALLNVCLPGFLMLMFRRALANKSACCAQSLCVCEGCFSACFACELFSALLWCALLLGGHFQLKSTPEDAGGYELGGPVVCGYDPWVLGYSNQQDCEAGFRTQLAVFLCYFAFASTIQVVLFCMATSRLQQAHIHLRSSETVASPISTPAFPGSPVSSNASPCSVVIGSPVAGSAAEVPPQMLETPSKSI